MTETRYALATFSHADGVPRAGLVIEGRIAALSDLAHSAFPPQLSVLDLLEDWEASAPALDRLAETVAAQSNQAPFIPVETVRMHPPVDLPRQVFCTGANYRQHVIDLTLDAGVGPAGLEGPALRQWAENMMDERAANGMPYVFCKPVSAVAGASDDLVVPATTQQLDWELELAVVIGKGGSNIPLERAMEHVAGYAIANDVSARDLIARTDYKMLGTDWLRSKSQPGFLPFGPLLVPSHLVADPHDLHLRLYVGDQLMQNESTSDMLFDIPRQISYISTYARLLPGDVICTGSPAGNGTHYKRFLKPGDVMRGEIAGLGVQVVRCVAPHGSE